MIEVTGLTKYYGNKVGIEDLTFSVQKGEILGFLGPNAAGKTTTMRLITGFMPPTRGVAKIAGFDVLDHPMEVKRRVGYLPENPPVYRDMTVADYLHFVAEIKEVPRKLRRRRVEEAMEMAGLGEVRSRLIQNISRGYRQRTGLAQALLNKPEVLILDEPTVGLDPKQIIDIRNLIKSLAGEHTIILSSHILPEVSMTCSRVMIVNKGRLVVEDTTAELANRLQNTQRVKMRIGGPAQEVVDKIRGVSGVQTVTADQEAECCVLEIDAEPGDELRGRLFFALADARWPILEMESVRLSLEEVFLQLTTEESSGGEEQ